MADMDIDDLLEAPYSKDTKSAEKDSATKPKDKSEKEKSKDKDKDRSKDGDSKDRKRKRSRSRDKGERRRSRSRDRDRRDRDRRRSRSPRRRPSRSRDRENGVDRGDRFRRRSRSPFGRRRSRSPYARGRGSPPRRMPGPERRDVMPFTPRLSPPRNSRRLEDLTPEERDARTVFVMQLSVRTRPRDLEEFFSSVGKVRDVRIITDSKTKRSKGIAYVEFYEVDSVNLALGLNNQRLLGAPLMIQPTQAEKNRIANATIGSGFSSSAPPPSSGPVKLYIGSLHPNVTEEMLRGIFEPFGRIESLRLQRDSSDRSKGCGHCTFYDGEDANKAMDHLNGFELAGKQMKVTLEAAALGSLQSLDYEDMDKQGLDLGTTGRLALMAKLAEGTGMKLPPGAQQVLSQNSSGAQTTGGTPPIATQCFMLSNMFDPATETSLNWDAEVRDDVIEECGKHGGILHIFVDKASPQGNVYVKCPTIASAVASVNSLHGRWFAGKVITANYVPVMNYHQLFPDAAAVR